MLLGTHKNHLNEHPKHMFKLMGKKIITFLHLKKLIFLTFNCCPLSPDDMFALLSTI